jgi:5-methylcytosine-specific restriction endonuclease McrA
LARAKSESALEKLGLLNLTEEDLNSSCRVTLERQFSIIDAIMLVKGCSRQEAARIYLRITIVAKEGKSDQIIIGVEFHQFQGERQRLTPVADFTTLLRILALIPGPEGDTIRASAANGQARILAGDHDLEAALPQVRAALPAAARDAMLQGLPSSEGATRKRQREHEEEQGLPKTKRIECTPELMYQMLPEGAAEVMPRPLLAMMCEKDLAGDAFDIIFRRYTMMAAEFRLQKKETLLLPITLRQAGSEADKVKAEADKVKAETVCLQNESKVRVDAIPGAVEKGEAKVADARIAAELKEREDRRQKADSRPRRRTSGPEIRQSDVQAAILRVFGGAHPRLSVPCEMNGCSNWACVVSCHIFAAPAYGRVPPEKGAAHVKVACHAHKTTREPRFASRLVVSPMDLVEAWVFNFGLSPEAACGICSRRISLADQLEVCHRTSVANGGSNDLENLVPGHPGCNRRQGPADLSDYHHELPKEGPRREYERITDCREVTEAVSQLRCASKRSALVPVEKRLKLALQKLKAPRVRTKQSKITFTTTEVFE